MNFNSRRSVLTCLNGCVASSQSLASQIGIDILKKGGNAADAAVAVAAALNVTEPCSTGLGGDAFCLFFDKKDCQVKGLNASGRASKHLTLKYLNNLGYNDKNMFPARHALSVTVPGACAGWVDCVTKFGSGRLSLKEILLPAINLARNGFPVSGPITSHAWQNGSEPLLAENNLYGKELLCWDAITEQFRAPQMGEVFKNAGLANVLESIAENGSSGFYKGWVANAIVDVVKEHGGVLSLDDLEENAASLIRPICIEYEGLKLWEIPPNGQGIVALEALNILKNFDLAKLQHNSKEYLHLLIETFRLSFADALQYCADMDHTDVPVDDILSEEYGKKRASLIDMKKAIDVCIAGDPPSCRGDTVYFTTADGEGNYCSFINSNYMGFGTGIVPKNCGFSLQNRGFNFSLKEGHPNVVSPRKRPYHTIIPAMVTDAKTGEVVMSYGVMGGFMQPQGHVQVLLNMLEYGMDPQQALDSPRVLVGSGHLSPLGQVFLEEGIDEETLAALVNYGHDAALVKGFERSKFGRGQIIARKKIWTKTWESRAFWVASDCRADGMAIGY